MYIVCLIIIYNILLKIDNMKSKIFQEKELLDKLFIAQNYKVKKELQSKLLKVDQHIIIKQNKKF